MIPYKFNCSRFLLPFYFKAIGIGIILIAGILWILKISHVVESVFWIRYISVIGLFAYVAAREKEDDEMIEKIRLYSFQMALIGSLLGILLVDVFFYFEGTGKVTSAIEFITIQLIAYIICFLYEMKRMKVSL